MELETFMQEFEAQATSFNEHQSGATIHVSEEAKPVRSVYIKDKDENWYDVSGIEVDKDGDVVLTIFPT